MLKPSSHPLNVGRVAWWMPVPGRFGGSTLVDLMGRYPAAAQGTAKWSNARPYSGAYLDGSTDYRAAADSLADFTACTYGVRFTPDSAFVAGGGQVLFARWIDDTSFHWFMTMVYGSNAVTTDSAAAYAYSAPWTPVAGVESMLVWTATGSRNGFSFYVDGVSQSVIEIVWSTGPNDTGACPFWIGGYNSTRQCSGVMAEAFVWNRVLSAAEVAELHAESRAGYPNLLSRDRSPVSLLNAAIPPPTPPGTGWLGIGYNEEDPMSITYGSWSTDSAISAATVVPGTDKLGSSLSLDGKAVAHLSFEYAKSSADGIGGDIVIEYLKDRDGTHFETVPGDLDKQVRRRTIPADGSTGSTTITVYASEGKAILPRVRVLGTSATVTLRTMTGTA